MPPKPFSSDTNSGQGGRGSGFVLTVLTPQVLLSIGYVWLDIRPTSEVERRGKLKDCVCIPFVTETRRFDPEAVCASILGSASEMDLDLGLDLSDKSLFHMSKQNQTAVTSSPNKDFLSLVEKRFPKKESVMLLVADANGRGGGPEALAMLENSGYVNLVSVGVACPGFDLVEVIMMNIYSHIPVLQPSVWTSEFIIIMLRGGS